MLQTIKSPFESRFSEMSKVLNFTDIPLVTIALHWCLLATKRCTFSSTWCSWHFHHFTEQKPESEALLVYYPIRLFLILFFFFFQEAEETMISDSMKQLNVVFHKSSLLSTSFFNNLHFLILDRFEQHKICIIRRYLYVNFLATLMLPEKGTNDLAGWWMCVIISSYY